jgi:uncharacterized protein (TIGR02246 family)
METHYHKFSNSSSADEYQITKLIDTYGQGFIDKDVDKILSVYSDDAVAFYEAGQLQVKGRKELEKFWEDCIDQSGTNDFAPHELSLRIDQNLAVAHYLSHVLCLTKSGERIDHWSRCTLSFVKEDDAWVVIHEHTSVPFEPNFTPSAVTH